MTTAPAQVKPFTYTNPQGLKLEVLFVLDLDKKGYINATAIAKQFGRETKDWLKNGSVQEYIRSLIEQMNDRATISHTGIKIHMSENSPTSLKSIGYDDLVITHHGSPESGGGTWLHPKLGVVFARWLSPHFAVWCDEQIVTLLQQHPEQQRQFPDLAVIFDKFTENQRQARQENAQFQRASQQRFHEIEQRFDTMEQRFAERLGTIEKVLNHFHTQSAQDTKQALGQIHNGINRIDKALSHQHQVDLLQPPIQDTFKQTLSDYQQLVEQMLRGHQDELIQGYLIGIKDNLERIAQRFPEPVVKIHSVELVTEIGELRAAGESWNYIAQCLNARGTVTASGKGKWYGSSVKRYVESQPAK